MLGVIKDTFKCAVFAILFVLGLMIVSSAVWWLILLAARWVGLTFGIYEGN